MIDRPAFLADAQKLVVKLEKDLRARCDDVPDVGQAVAAEYKRAKGAGRTGQTLEEWRADAITQQAVAWVLSCVFGRFLEDNRLLDPPKLAGPGERLNRARDEHESFFRSRPRDTDREYLLAVFDDLAKRAGTRDLFGEHNPIRQLPGWLSPDAAKDLLLPFFQRIDPESGRLVHDFTDPSLDTRFLGDLYQDLSEAARKKYALLQTPIFVEAFILARTLEPAIDTFGLDKVSLIDPACGSGHFLLGAFGRLLDHWTRKEPATPRRELVQRALDAVHGVDLNPYAVAIARFRLLLAAWQACGVTSLANAPVFRLNLACGDSLLHGSTSAVQGSLGFAGLHHHYQPEDPEELERLLRPGTYHAVIANPPYITPKDRGLNEKYRERYSACHMKYSLSVPFMQRIFDLACEGGYTGQITANSFMKREFGKKLIQEFFPTIDLTHVIDTSGAYIPGHGTPTVILFGRQRRPAGGTIRTVLGIRGEPTTPDDPARGQVWSAIVGQIDQPGSLCAFVSVADSPRENFHRHPWSIGGGGAAELKEQLDEAGDRKLEDFVSSIGFASFTGSDEVFLVEPKVLDRHGVPAYFVKDAVLGDNVRDWQATTDLKGLVPYDGEFRPVALAPDENWCRYLWGYRTAIGSVISFGGRTRIQNGDAWWTWYRWIEEKYRIPLSITFAEVATHNHFVLDHGGKVFKQTAPVIKLPTTATEDDHLALVGLLNSSTACFWMKQVCFPKGTTTGDISTEKGRPEANRYAFSSTAIGSFPVPRLSPLIKPRLLLLAGRLCQKAAELTQTMPEVVVPRWSRAEEERACLKKCLDAASAKATKIKRHMVYLQEELDWLCYQAFSLIPLEKDWRLDEMAEVDPSLRPFCWETAEQPESVPANLGRPYAERRSYIDQTSAVQLIESPLYKRPWLGRQGVYGSASRSYEEKTTDAIRAWLFDRLESYFDLDGRMNDAGTPTSQVDVSLLSTAKLADLAGRDPAFQTVADLYRGRPDFDVVKLVTELVEAESVPLLPVLRYKPSGLDKRRAWERTWELQRQEDAIDHRASKKGLGVNDGGWSPATDDGKSPLNQAQADLLKKEKIGPIPPPPKYKSADFQKGNYWRLRGTLDVPKERWVSFPHCEGADGLPLIAWAGYDHLQLAKAIAAHYVHVQEQEGGRDDPRLVPLLACLIELLPWLKQWHNEIDPEFNMGMGDYFEGFVQDEARLMNKTLDEVRAWQPLARAGRGRRRTATEPQG
jgi:hypothetical protein